ncbi:MAG TPA: hypothetical protein VK427_16660 [Kofleriaceae bacterium]|nr:hypothetical protein [Kofleriaceae bacterium]
MADSDELIKNAGRFFKKLGGQIKDTAQVASAQLAKTTKQVTGLGRGTVKLELEHTRIPPGGSVTGRVVLILDEPIEAKRVLVMLRARQKHLTIPAGTKIVTASHADVYEHVEQLSGPTTYQHEGFAFSLTVPADAHELAPKAAATPLGEVARSIATAVSPTPAPIEWEVVAELDVAWGRNLTSSVAITIA